MVSTVDIGNTNISANRAVPLAIHVIGRSLLQHELIPTKDLIFKEKLAAEAGQSKIKRNIGWTKNTRTLIIALPDDKATAWTNTIESIIRN